MKLSQQQLLATNHIDGPALVLAVPGAGKTTMLLYRTINLIKNGVDPEKIVTITFSKSSALDMKKRFQSLFPHRNLKVTFATIHSFSYKILLEYSRLRGAKFKLIEEQNNSKFEILSKIYYSLNNKTVSEEILEEIVNAISYIKNSNIKIEQFKTEIANFKELYNLYEKYKRNHNLIDFDDMITKSIEILKEDEYIRQKYKKLFNYYQLDEGQDTSIAQFELIKILVSPKNNLFIVADDDQSIYSFRGADPKYLLNFKNIFKNTKIYYMQNNFRSTKNIVNTSNKFIKLNKNRFEKDIETTNNFKNPINIIKCSNTNDQYEFIYKSILENPSEDYAIIYRNNLSSLGLVEYLERKNISFNIKGKKLKFFNHFIIKDILLIIQFSQNPDDIKALSKIYYKIKGYISKKHIEYLQMNGGKNLLKDLLKYPNLPSYYKDNIFDLISSFKNMKNKSIHKQIELVLSDLEYDIYLRDFSKKFAFNYDSLREYIHHLKFIAKSEKTLESLLGRLEHLEYITHKNQDINSNITLSTIHSVKGLEFKNVFIIDLVNGVLPSSKSDKDQELLEEERRLFYVAMTRAKENLYLLYPKNYNDSLTPISSFLNEISKY